MSKASGSRITCFIDTLPSELLVHIFALGSAEEDIDTVEDRRIIKLSSDEKDAPKGDVLGDGSSSFGKGKGKLSHVDVVDVGEIDNDVDWSDEDDDGEEEDGEDVEDAVPFPVLVSHVCHRWREIVLGIPTLWVKLRFTQDFNKEQAATCIARAKDAPLDINIDLAENEEDVTARIIGEEPDSRRIVDSMREIMDLLIPQAYHWGQLFVESTSFEAIHHMLSRLSSSECVERGAPLLELIHIGYCDETEIPVFEVAIFRPSTLREGLRPFGGNLPSLKELSLWEVHLDWSIFDPTSLNSKIPTRHAITNLTALELRYHTGDVRPTIEEFRACLLGSPNLESLALFASAPHPLPEVFETQWYSETVQLKSLVSLALGTLPPKIVIALLKMMVMPAIQRFTVEFEGDDYSDVITQLAKEVESPDGDISMSSATRTNKWSIASNLSYLKLGSLMCSDAALQQLYCQLRNVDTLDLNMNYIPESAGRLLFQVDKDETSALSKFYCPKLRKIFVSGVVGDEVCQLVKARASGGAPLEEVMLDVNIHLHKEDMDFLQKNVLRVEFVEYSDEEDDDEDDEEEEDDEESDEDESGDEERGEDDTEDGEGDGEDEWEDEE